MILPRASENKDRTSCRVSRTQLSCFSAASGPRRGVRRSLEFPERVRMRGGIVLHHDQCRGFSQGISQSWDAATTLFAKPASIALCIAKVPQFRDNKAIVRVSAAGTLAEGGPPASG